MPDPQTQPAAASDPGPLRLDPAAELAALWEQMPVGVYSVAPDGGGLRANRALRRMLGDAAALPPWPEAFRRRLMAEGRVTDFLRPWPAAAGAPDWVAESAWLLRDPSGGAVAIGGTVVDATERVRAEASIAQAARHDALTGLPNRLAFHERLDAAAGAGTGATVLLLDLDRFKAVNDAFGHLAGDALLQGLGARMAALMGPGDLLARFGGDEFGVVHPKADPAAAARLAERLLAAARLPLAVEGRGVVVGASLGVAFLPGDGAGSAELIQAADVALYEAKAAGGNAARVYDPAMAATARARRRLEGDLRAALDRGEFGLVYQPIRDAATGATEGHEALLRWRRPGEGVVPAERFIGLAADLGLLPVLGAWALERACREAAGAPEAGSIWVNVSPVQLAAADFEATLAAALEGAGLAPDRLVLEITETALMGQQSELAPRIDRLRARGLRLALDDFGTGYSALGYLSRFAFDVIKIDKSFIQDLDRPQTAAIVGCVLDLARRLGIDTVGEGVETEAQFAALRAAGCRYAQGHIFGPPAARLG